MSLSNITLRSKRRVATSINSENVTNVSKSNDSQVSTTNDIKIINSISDHPSSISSTSIYYDQYHKESVNDTDKELINHHPNIEIQTTNKKESRLSRNLRQIVSNAKTISKQATKITLMNNKHVHTNQDSSNVTIPTSNPPLNINKDINNNNRISKNLSPATLAKSIYNTYKSVSATSDKDDMDYNTPKKSSLISPPPLSSEVITTITPLSSEVIPTTTTATTPASDHIEKYFIQEQNENLIVNEITIESSDLDQTSRIIASTMTDNNIHSDLLISKKRESIILKVKRKLELKRAMNNVVKLEISPLNESDQTYYDGNKTDSSNYRSNNNKIELKTLQSSSIDSMLVNNHLKGININVSDSDEIVTIKANNSDEIVTSYEIVNIKANNGADINIKANNSDEIVNIKASNNDELVSIKPSNIDKDVYIKPSISNEVINIKANNGDEIVNIKANNGDEIVNIKANNGDEIVNIKANNGDEIINIKANNGDEIINIKASNIDEVINVKLNINANHNDHINIKAKDSDKFINIESSNRGEIIDIKASNFDEIINIKASNSDEGLHIKASKDICIKANNGDEVVSIKAQNIDEVINIKVSNGGEIPSNESCNVEEGHLITSHNVNRNISISKGFPPELLVRHGYTAYNNINISNDCKDFPRTIPNNNGQVTPDNLHDYIQINDIINVNNNSNRNVICSRTYLDRDFIYDLDEEIIANYCDRHIEDSLKSFSVVEAESLSHNVESISDVLSENEHQNGIDLFDKIHSSSSFVVIEDPIYYRDDLKAVTASIIDAEKDAKPLALIRFIHLLIRYSPSLKLKQYLISLEVYIVKWASAIHFILLSLYIIFEILLELGFELYVILKPYRIDLLLSAFVGFIMCFFGGFFVTTIAAVEAYRLCGYDSTMKCLRDLSEEFHTILEVSTRELGGDITKYIESPDYQHIKQHKQVYKHEIAVTDTTIMIDDTIDTRLNIISTPVNKNRLILTNHHRNNSTSPSLQEFQREQELVVPDTMVNNLSCLIQVIHYCTKVASKALYFLHHVDPLKFSDAVIGINAGFIAVIATLKLQFAKTITLASSMSKAIELHTKPFLLPFIKLLLPKMYHKWSEVLLSYSIKSISLSVAWTLRRVISSYHSAIRGGLLCSKNIILYLIALKWIQGNQQTNVKINVTKSTNMDMNNNNIIKDEDITSNCIYVLFLERIIGYTLAIGGIYFQLSYGFALPFPLNIILFPITLLEYVLVWMINNSSSYFTTV